MGLRSLLDQDIGIDDIVQEQPATNEFNVIHALGRVYRRAAKGEFGLPIAGAQTWMNHYTTTDANAKLIAQRVRSARNHLFRNTYTKN